MVCQVDLATGEWEIIAQDVISGATSIVVNESGTRAYLTQFGIETDYLPIVLQIHV